jgi:hypothetical protein
METCRKVIRNCELAIGFRSFGRHCKHSTGWRGIRVHAGGGCGFCERIPLARQIRGWFCRGVHGDCMDCRGGQHLQPEPCLKHSSRRLSGSSGAFLTQPPRLVPAVW